MSATGLTATEYSVLDGLAREYSLNAAGRPGHAEVGEAIRKAVALLREQERISPAEERAAWDAYVAANGSPDVPVGAAAKRADALLEQRRERFGGAR